MTIEAECYKNNKNGKETYSLLQFLAVDTMHTKRMLAGKKKNECTTAIYFSFLFYFAANNKSHSDSGVT